uniref:Uncharacterized protein n=1 Tax=Amphimedon queenslandica TaxID=400682 RepID=A0A1X7ULK8_AMPQE
MHLLSVIAMYLLQRLHVDNRFLMIGGFVLGCIGTVLVGDWQSIRGDPCSIGFSRNFIPIVVSDLIGKSKEGSGWLMGLMMAASGLSQSVGPLWTNPLYLLVGNRTWLVSTILSSLQFILIILFIIFFKQFKAKKE